MPKILLCALALFVLVGCDAFSSSEPVAFSRLALPAAPVYVNGTTFIRDQTTLEGFARRWDGSTAPLPEVDFTRQMVLGVFYGGSLHAGCISSVEVVESVRAEGDALVVHVGPLPDLGACRAVVYPAEMVVVDAATYDVRFEGHLPE